MTATTRLIERSLAVVGGTAAVLAAAAGGARLFGAAGLAVDDSMARLFDDQRDPTLETN